MKKSENRRFKNGAFFTLVELLVVIGIIAILAALLLPAIGKVREKAKIAKARAQINSIVIAVKNYESTYGLLPWTDTSDLVLNTYTFTDTTPNDGFDDDPETAGDEQDYNKLMEVLTCVDGPDTANTTALGNTRMIRFLDTNDKYSTRGYIDPWNMKFGVALDLTYSGVINLNEDSDEDDVAAGDDVAGSVAVWSFGPDKTTGNSDDVCSWK